MPGFCIDVPYERSEESVREVIAQLHDLMSFIGEQTGKPVDERALVAACERSWRCALAWRRFFEASPGRRLPADMTSEMYAFLMNHVVLGSSESERFCQMLADEMEGAPGGGGGEVEEEEEDSAGDRDAAIHPLGAVDEDAWK